MTREAPQGRCVKADMMYHAPARVGTPHGAYLPMHTPTRRRFSCRRFSGPVKIDRASTAPPAAPAPPPRKPRPPRPPLDRARALDELAELARGTHTLCEGRPVDVSALLDEPTDGTGGAA